MHRPRVILVTGGAGFVGSNLIRYVFENTAFTGKIVNLDKLTYAGNLQSLSEITHRFRDRYAFVHGDIADPIGVAAALREHDVDTIVHCAAESHVDRSIQGPSEFITTNIVGTYTLIDAAKNFWGERTDTRFHHVSTDEVYGTLGPLGRFVEESRYDPRSPYSASKAASDHLVRAWHYTYGMPVTVSHSSNNYGPYQFPEKLIPLMIDNMLAGKPLPLYGDGLNVRDWLYVDDHAAAIWAILTLGQVGTTYNIGGENEWSNLDLVRFLCRRLAEIRGTPAAVYEALISFVTDRAGHDRRYAIDCSKLRRDLGWNQKVTFEQGLDKTIRWYLDHRDWVLNVTKGKYKESTVLY
jgi:dTDP-glucose 4,6-dehydratase